MRRTVRIISLSWICTLGGMFLCNEGAYAQNDPVVQRMFLVGDAGELKDGHHPVCDWLKLHIDWNDSSNTLVYLGDNIYPDGLPSEGGHGYDQARAILDYQISVVAGKKAHAFFVPGNHDWKEGRPGGLAQVRREGEYIESLQLSNVDLLPKNGCPGPISVEVGDKMVLVCMDSQWWLQQDDRPGNESDCDCKDEKAIINGIRDIVSTYPDKLIVLAMHHPFYTHGGHGGNFPFSQWLGPVPVFGTLYTLGRSVFGNIQDTRNPRYKDLIGEVEDVIRGHSNVVHVAGHDHSLQLLQHDSVYYVVSGAGSKESHVGMGAYSLFARSEAGFAVIEVHASGKPEIRFFDLSGSDLSKHLYAAELPGLKAKETVAEAVKTFPDSVTVVAYPGFKAGGFKKWLLGSNYRVEWGTPVRVKVFDMNGWTPIQRGGGLQTRSLRMKNPQGEEFVLRGVRKYVTDAALPASLKGAALVKDVVSDGVSASYPYAAVSVPPFTTVANVPHADPVLVYMPDDPRLGRFRSDYGNLFGLFEQREPGNGKKTYNTEDLDKKLRQDNDNTVDQRAVLAARLVDMFIMDFDRHEDQWRWLGDDNGKGKGKTFAPVPRDRDQPFFINKGVIPWLAGSAWATPQLQGFRPKARNINTFNHNARNFDRNYLNGLSEEDWRKAAEAVVALMTDSLIEGALHLQPGPIQPYHKDWIVAQLKARRKYYVDEVMHYYRFLSGTVSIFGSDKQELFDIDRRDDGSVRVIVYKLNKDGDTSKVLYDRSFAAGVTHEIRIYGFGGDDKFRTHGNGGGSIHVRMIGGPGADTFDNESEAAAGKTKIYDFSGEKNTATGKGNYRTYFSSDPAVNSVNRLGYLYNILAPLATVGYNPDDGVSLGLGFQYTTQGFHKDPFKTRQTLMLTHALATKAWAFKYNFEATHAIGKLDFLGHALVKAPNNTINFFGLGNETVYLKDTKDGIRYYRARYTVYDGDVQLRKRMGSAFSLALGPVFQHFAVDSGDNKDRFLNTGNPAGVDHSTLYEVRNYMGGRATMIVDRRNDKVLTTRGLLWETNFGLYGGLNDASKRYSQLNSELSLYGSFNSRGNVVISSRLGYGKTFGDFQFYQAQYLGATENLRGYRKFRFAGDEMFYHNLDLRIRLTDFQTYLFPGSLGVNFFNDIGRVWVKGEKGESWHDGVGGGIWLAPLKKFVITANYGEGTEGGVFMIKMGFQY